MPPVASFSWLVFVRVFVFVFILFFIMIYVPQQAAYQHLHGREPGVIPGRDELAGVIRGTV